MGNFIIKQMKNKLFLLLIGILTSNIFGQNVHVFYDTDLFDEDLESVAVLYTRGALITNQKESIYYYVYKDTLVNYEGGQYGRTYEEDEEIPVYDLNEIVGVKHYKDLNSKSIVYTSNIIRYNKIIIDNNYAIKDWQITENTKTILGYECQEAVCTFRGRSYKAYFSTALPYSSGPYKFDGLPGLILEVISNDEKVHIYAKEVKTTDIKIFNPYEDEKNVISWEEFKKEFIKEAHKINTYYRSQGVKKDMFPYRQIEYYTTD